ncbi:MAG: PH domain-containing protein [Candidatus Pseudobacter hemicellulosilyticus]|uniref:PH domain-containing protein n=1 Tax=Candidatus Pseudobacter hemicellulosilyticus TaxID=3121375 RepID=A0AAJ5WYM3_9BACT|nr:MAG: PH domain-containing protein [Pseudobacter sp.]
MEFLNAPVDTETLPKAEDVAFKPIERSYFTVLRWQWGLSTLVLLAIGAGVVAMTPGLYQPRWWMLVLGSITFGCLVWRLAMEKGFSVKAYAVRERDIIYRTGWFVQRIHTCPFNRVLHSTVTAGPIERRYGLAALVLYSAGPNDTDLKIPGLVEADAYALKEWITKKIVHEPDAAHAE